jgi:hypothetical protein
MIVCVLVQDQSCVASGEVFTTPAPQIMRPAGRLPAGACSPKVAECRKRVQMRERKGNAPGELRDGVGSSRDDYGHWIKDDEDCKFAQSFSTNITSNTHIFNLRIFLCLVIEVLIIHHHLSSH